MGQTTQTVDLRPVRTTDRIAALDAVRGFALLGILVVNIHFFSAPVGQAFSPAPIEGSSWLDAGAHYVVKALATGKFYPLFSMLFGMGMAMQLMRVRAAGRGFSGFYWRRLLVLGALGFGHAVLLWYGDILFVYAIAGALMMPLVGLRARTLAVLGAGLVVVSAVMMGGMTALEAVVGPDGGETAETAAEPQDHAIPEDPGANAGAAEQEQLPVAGDHAAPASSGVSESEAAATESDTGPVRALLEGFAAGAVTEGPEDPLWMEAERSAHAEGPFTDLLIMRVLNWAAMLVFWQVLMGGFVHVLAMFCFGAALMKIGFFDTERRGLQRQLLALGLAAGLPLVLIATFWPVADDRIIPAKLGAGVATVIGGPLVSVGYLAAITLIVGARPAALAARWLSSLGRLALTNYLMQTLLATMIFYYWGFGLFGQVSTGEAVGAALAIYTFQVAFSTVWLRMFRIGPAEWVWRSLTYLRPQPLLRERSASART